MIPIVSVIQARMSSSRLPGKVLKPLGGVPVLAHVVNRAAAFSVQVVVCTSTDPSDDAIEQHCNETQTLCVRGSLDNVFARYRQALSDPRVHQCQWFARITADCPLVSPTMARTIIEAAWRDLDYVSAVNAELPRGLGIELIRRTAFESIDSADLDAPEREHVTLRLYEQPDRYRCAFVAPPTELRCPQFRLTLDYAQDYELLTKLFESDPSLSAVQAVAFLKAHPAVAELNRDCEQRAARESS